LALLLLGVLSLSQPAQALRNPDMSGDDSGAVVVYTFDENGGTTAFDTSGSGTPLNIDMSVAGNLPTADGTTIRTNASLQSGYLLINPKPNGAEFGQPDTGYQSAQLQRTFLVSSGAAAKLNSCTGGFTVQTFLRPWFPFQGSNSGNLIVGLSNSDGAATLVEPNFGVYQSGQAGAESIMMSVRTGAGSSATLISVPGAFSSVRQTDNPGALTEVIATQEPNGVLSVYVNRIPRSTLTPVAPVFSSTAKLVIGNELVALTMNPDGTANVSQQKNWSGEIYHMAIYCNGFTRSQILGAAANNIASAAVVVPLDAPIAPSRTAARQLVERLTGVAVPIDHPMVIRVEQKILAGDSLGAAKIVTGDLASGEPGHPEFYNTLVKQMAMKMSNRDETIRAPFNDFAAAFIGETRDERNAKELLTDNFFYMGDPAKVGVRSNVFNDILVSNNHYQDLESGNWDIGKVLKRVDASHPVGAANGQMVATDSTGIMVQHPDPAGVITSRAYMSAHAIAGTNRRIVEYTFREFMCIPLIEVADTSASPARIGRDVDRTPGGDATKFETSCKGCHSIQDGMRGAFAHFDYANITMNGGSYGVVRHTEVSNGNLGFDSGEVDQFGTVYKMNHNETVFPDGYVTTDTTFVNNAIGLVNGPRFGWGGAYQLGGIGAHQFGQMIADSNRFSQCMAKRVYEAVCTPGQTSGSTIIPVVDGFATKFRANGYNLKNLFQIVASDPACAAGMGR
jgi:hypothetical protein